MKKKSILTIHKQINRNKYNKVFRSSPPKDIKKEYEIRDDGWRKKYPH